MRRLAAESLLVGAVLGGLAAAWFAPGADAVCGPDGTAFAWRVGQLQAWWAGDAPLAKDGALAVPVAGLPYVALGALLAPTVGVAKAWLVAAALAVGGGAAALWGLVRAGGGTPVGAALAVALGVAPPVLAGGLGRGGFDLAVVPFVALALALLPARGAAPRALGVLAVLLCGLCDARTGVVAGVAAAAAGGGGPALLAALLAAGTGAAAASGTLDPVDLPAPFVLLRPEAVAPGLAALAATLWAVESPKLRLAAAVGFVAALGPVLAAFGDVLTVGGAAVPLPGVVVAALTPSGEGWGGALVVAAVAAALGVGHLAAPRAALLLAPLALFEGARAAGPAPTCFVLDAPVAVRALGERTGGVLNLPVTATVGERTVGAPAGAHGLYLAQRALHGRAVATGLAPLPASHPLYLEPAVVLALGADAYLLPPARPGEAARGLGITEIVVHRRLFAPSVLALADPVLARLYGAPQRDHAGEVDLYRIDPEGPVRAPLAEPLRPTSEPAPNGYLDLARYLAGLSPSGGSGSPTGDAAGAPAAPGAAGEIAGAGEAAPVEAAAAGDEGSGAAAGRPADGRRDGARGTGAGPRNPPRADGPRNPRPKPEGTPTP